MVLPVAVACASCGGLPCTGGLPVAGLSVFCRLRFAGGLPCAVPVAVACPVPVACRLRVCRCFAGCGLPAVCPAPVDWVVAVALFSVSGTAAGSGGKPPPVRKTEKNHSTKKTDVPTEHPEKRGEIFRKYYNYFCVGVRNIGFLINPIRV